MVLERRNHGKGHSYRIDGAKVPGVTTILGGSMPKPALVNWAGNVTAEWAVDHWAELSELTPSKRLAELKGARFADRDAAANRGTQVHALAERYIAGVEVEIPDELSDHVAAYQAFVEEWEVKEVLVEAVVANRKIWYCGTVDLVADLGDGHRYLLDIKTSRSGIYPESALQLAAYRFAETYALPDDKGKLVEHPMADLGIERVAAIHVRGDGYDLRPLRADEDTFRYFQHLAYLYRRAEELEEWVMPAVRRARKQQKASA